MQILRPQWGKDLWNTGYSDQKLVGQSGPTPSPPLPNGASSFKEKYKPKLEFLEVFGKGEIQTKKPSSGCVRIFFFNNTMLNEEVKLI